MPEADFSGLVSLVGEPSATSSGTPTAKKSSPKGRKTVTSTSRPSSGTCASSLVQGTPSDIAAWLTSSLPDSPVNRFRSPAGEPLALTSAICGPQLRKFCEWSDRSGFWERTSADSSQLSLLTEAATSEPYSETWPKWGTSRLGACWEQTTPALRTAGSGCGSSDEWQTPTAQLERGGTATRSDGTLLLTDQVRAQNWTTPTVGDSSDSTTERPSRATTGRTTEYLNRQVAQNWPTATAGDAKSAGSRCIDGSAAHAGTSLTDAVRPDRAKAGNWPTPSAAVRNDSEAVETFDARRILLKEKWGNGNGAGEPLEIAVKRPWPTPREAEHKGCGPKGCPAQIHRLDRGYLDATVEEQNDKPVGALSPDWTETLMGFPIGWTAREPLSELVWPALDGAWPAPPGAPQHPWEPPRTGVGIKDRRRRLKV